MLDSYRKNTNIVIVLSSIALLIAGYIYESPLLERSLILIGLSVLFILGIVLMYVSHFSRKEYMYIGLMVVLAGIVYYSKYAINYYYQLLFIFLILSIIMNVEGKIDRLLSLLVVLFSMIGLIQLVLVSGNYFYLTFLVFFSIIEILVIVMFVIGKAYFISASENQELLKLSERTIIARDLHDTLGHEMTGLIMHLELTKGTLQENHEMGMNMLDESLDLARDSLKKVRGIVDTLRDDTKEMMSIPQLIDVFQKKTGVLVTYHINKELNTDMMCYETMYRIVQEAMTNSVKHSDASMIDITLINGTNEVMFEIVDNGSLTQSIHIGNGLKGMKERVELLNGTIQFEHQNGFKITGIIPKGGKS